MESHKQENLVHFLESGRKCCSNYRNWKCFSENEIFLWKRNFNFFYQNFLKSCLSFFSKHDVYWKNTFQNFSKNSSQLLLMMNSIGLPMKSSRLPWGWKFAVLNWNWGRSTSPEMLRVSRANCCPPWTNWEPGREASTWSGYDDHVNYYGEPHHHLWHHQHHDFPPEPEGR